MNDDDAVRLNHMIGYCELALGFVVGQQRHQLDSNKMLELAVVRAIEIVGEAASKISAEAQAKHPDIPWRAIIGMRNRLVHAYFDINTEVVWQTITVELPALLPKLQAIAVNQLAPQRSGS